MLYPEIAHAGRASGWNAASASHGQDTCRSASARTRDFIAEVAALAGVDPRATLGRTSRAALVLALGRLDLSDRQARLHLRRRDPCHRRGPHRVARELGFTVVGLGTYSREFAREVREAAKGYGVEALITDDYLEVEGAIAELQPELVLGTQMERHIAKRLGIPCAVISAPVHVQDFPARYSPQMGFEGANVIFDTWVHPLMMGLEEHLLGDVPRRFRISRRRRAVASRAPTAAPPRSNRRRAGRGPCRRRSSFRLRRSPGRRTPRRS